MITLQGVSKSFQRKLVLDDIHLTVQPHDICCLLGKNGAGKSTLINIIARLISQDKGAVLIKGQVFDDNKILIKEKIGLVSQFDYLIEQLTGYQYLEFSGLLYKMKPADIKERINSLSLFFFENTTDIHQVIKGYSSGMRMKLNIMAALLHKPDILLLDEPFANLDPVTCHKLAGFLQEFAAAPGKLVIISSHDLLYVDKIATRICVLHDKKVVFDGDKESFTNGGAKELDKQLLELINPAGINTASLNWLT
ncbi:ABC transporter ATP-binding protein [Chitinophaga sp. HK235]|uniref:ABC transporter ATP-binding protein n=1 Tax=Chitinophaga sp. HK235 TaxID=2952571 RepID=UPI001BA7B1D4|nr:ABC transporter ATP-binding protein [Chitinophaga sp. HK235]